MQSLYRIFDNLSFPKGSVWKILTDDDRTFYKFYEDREIKFKKNNKSPLYGGVNKFKYSYKNYKFVFHETFDEGHNFAIYRKNKDDEQKCLFIMLNDEGEAYIDNISFYKDCIKLGLDYPGGGSILLKTAIMFLTENKNKYNIKIIRLRDTSNLFCHSIGKNLDFSLIYMLTHAETWYGKYGFLPYDTDKKITDQKKYNQYKKNSFIVKNTLVKDTNIFSILYKYIKLKSLQNDFPHEKFIKFYDFYKNKSVMTFFKDFLNADIFNKSCKLYNYAIDDIVADLNITIMSGWSFYLKI